MKHTLSPEDQAECHEIAQQRQAANRLQGNMNRKIGSQSDLDAELKGVGGEWSAARVLGVEPDRTIGTHNGYDLKLGNLTVDVKSTEYSFGMLATPLRTIHHPADIYLLVVGKFPDYDVIGYLEGSVFLTPAFKGELRPDAGPCYCASQSQLRPLWELLNTEPPVPDRPYDWPDECEKEELTKEELAMVCSRCYEPLWQLHEHKYGDSYTWNAGFEHPDLCSYCNHVVEKDD